MLLVLILFSINLLFSQTTYSEIQNLDQKLPNYKNGLPKEKTITFKEIRSYDRPYKIINLDEIIKSQTHLAAIKKGGIIHDIKTNDQKIVPKDIYVRVFNQEDENGFKYIKNEDDSVVWKVSGRMVESLKEDLKMYEPPELYSPAVRVSKSYIDKELSFLPELIFHTGIIHGNYMQDLFNDKNASFGVGNQYGIHFFTKWTSPLKAGGVLHLERSNFSSGSGSYINYNSISAGPQLKTKDFDLKIPIRLQTQFRVGPFASAKSRNQLFKFYSNDLLLSLEMPFKNNLGEFVFGFYYQRQWLNLKDQSSPVNLKSDGKTNNSYGLSIAQVFE
jgi:hypothetical protein